MKNPPLVLAVCTTLLLAACQSSPEHAAPATPPIAAQPAAPALEPELYVFGWGEQPAVLAQPRGGSSRGAPVTLAPALALPLPAIAHAADAFARDRAAILALAGDYKVSFHFMEALGFATDYKPTRP